MDWDSVIGPKDDDPQEEVTLPSGLSDWDGTADGDFFNPSAVTEKLSDLSKALAKDDPKKVKLPDIVPLSKYPDKDEREPELIEGLLRMGHKGMISAGSKAGKSFLAIELGLLVAAGGKFLGHQCQKSDVLYVNLEISEPSFVYRCYESLRALGIKDDEIKDRFKMMHLRGAALSLDRMALALVDAIKNEYIKSMRKFSLIILDPIYKISNGEENNARDVSRFCNQLDMIAKETGCAIVYCHHHSKGDQAYKKAQDRASGSGVFARDADVIIDMVQLELDPQTKSAIRNDFMAVRYLGELEKSNREWKSLVPEDKKNDSGFLANVMIQAGIKTWEGVTNLTEELEEQFDKLMEGFVPMRVEYTVREFKTPKPEDIIFIYPIHYVDDKGLLAGAEPERHIQEDFKSRTQTANETRLDTFEAVVDGLLYQNGEADYQTIMDMAGIKSLPTLRKRFAEFKDKYEVIPGKGNTKSVVRFKQNPDKGV